MSRGVAWLAGATHSAREGGENPPRTRRRNGWRIILPSPNQRRHWILQLQIWEGRFGRPKSEDLRSLCAVPSRLGNTVRHADVTHLVMRIMRRIKFHLVIVVIAPIAMIASTTTASDFASAVLSYVPGSNPASGFTNPLVALGPPERMTGEGFTPGAVTPFHPCFSNDEIVSIGAGGQLTLAFDPPLRNQPNNPFGIDFIVFGNSFFTDAAYPTGTVAALAWDGGTIQVSADGITWVTVANTLADGLFPTMGSVDAAPYSPTVGAIATDPNKPVDPSWTAATLAGKSFAELVEIYAGSAGGAGVDLATVGLTEVIAVRILVPSGIHPNVEIDSVARVRSTGSAADIDHNGFVDGADLAAVLSAFGTDSPAADINQSGLVDGSDLAAVLAGWTI